MSGTTLVITLGLVAAVWALPLLEFTRFGKALINSGYILAVLTVLAVIWIMFFMTFSTLPIVKGLLEF